VSAQNAQEIMNKSFEKCQSIINGQYSMNDIQKFSNMDTLFNQYECKFTKFPEDTSFSLKFVFSSFQNNKLIEKYIYTGNELIRLNPSNKKALIYSKDKWNNYFSNEIKPLIQLFSPVTDKNSSPLYNYQTSDTINWNLKRSDDEIIQGKLCYKIVLAMILEESPIENFKVLKFEQTLWIKQESFIPIKYNFEYANIAGPDTLSVFESKTISNYKFNYLMDTSQFSIKSVPKNYRKINYKVPESIELLPSGTKAPSWSLISSDNKSYSSKQINNKIVLLDFFYMACFPCSKAIPHLQKLYDHYKDKGLEIYGINPFDKVKSKSDKSKFEKFIQKYGITYPIMLNAENTAKEFHISGYPSLYIIDPKGIILYSKVGYTPGDETDWQKIILNSLEEK
jgi:peroxiredoxin